MPTPKTAARPMARRDDYGAPIATYLDKQSADQRAVLDHMVALIQAELPEAQAGLKWGMPVFEIGGKIAVALRATKTGVGMMFSGPPEVFVDPDGRLEGDAKNMRQIKVNRPDDLPAEQVRGWLAEAGRVARGG